MIFFFIYDHLVLPVLTIVFYFIAMFNKKVAKSLETRMKYREVLKNINLKKSRILIHAASMGEFEHIKPLISRITTNIDVSIIVTFFSPSGYENVREFPGVDLIMYLPVDRRKAMKEFYEKLALNLIILSKHDAWPNQVRVAHQLNIPILLVNASLSPQSKRLKWPARGLLRDVYRMISTIYTISDKDKKLFESNYPNVKVRLVGDTKFDQVLIRKDRSQNLALIPDSWLSGKKVMVCGSIWPEDIGIIKKALFNLIKQNKFWNIILVPHDPNDSIIKNLVDFFGAKNCIKYTNLKMHKNEPILIIDTIGVLADIYKYASMAFVGGGFKQGIHNVMEPAVYGIPVLYGPKIDNASEAIEMSQSGGGIIIQDSQDFENIVNKFLNDKEKRITVGKKALNFTQKNTGATGILLEEIKRYLGLTR